MGKFVIEGGRVLRGCVNISGAKNAAVAILPAAVVSDGVCVLENVPKIRDVDIIVDILTSLGADVEWLGEHTLRIDPTGITGFEVAGEEARQMRASYYFLGALLTRFQKAIIALPGGCNLGARPIDQHLKAFSALGCDVEVKYNIVNAVCKNGLAGSRVLFDTVSVGATVNAILAAVKARGMTILENVAKEPHIVDIANFLNSMGADIRGAGTDTIKIRGVSYLRGTTYSIIPDQIEAGTYMAVAVATGGDVTVKNVIPKHLESIISRLTSTGAEIEEFEESVRVRRTGPISSTNVRTMPHPGFPTDMQPQISVVLSLASGTSIITESIWDDRFKYVDELRRMGSRIQVDGRVAVIEGIPNFIGAQVRATDLRAGFALIIAALVAEGVTEIDDIYHIDRGYEDVAKKLSALGANIKRVED